MKRAPNRALVEKRRQISWLVVLPAIGVLQICGCTVGPTYKRPTAEVPTAYKELANWKQAQPNDQNLGGNWWEMFQDPQLNALELQVNVSNQNLKAAEAQYTQARALVRYNRAAYFPTLTGGASASRNKISSNRPPSLTTNGRTYNDFQIPFQLSYEVDVWGRIRRTVESYREQAQAIPGHRCDGARPAGRECLPSVSPGPRTLSGLCRRPMDSREAYTPSEPSRTGP